MDNIKYLSDLELEIYHYVISHKDTITNMKMKDLSAILHVSPAMISRVAKKLGYAGFAEWKIALKIDINEYVKPNESNLNYIMDFFQRVNDGEFDENVREVGKMVAKADTVLFYGLGISDGIAKAGAMLFNRKGKNAIHVEDFSSRIDVFHQDDVAIVLTVSGETPEMIQVLTLLKERHIQKVAITNRATSLAARSSDRALCYYMPNVRDQYFFSNATQVPVIYYLEAIANELKQYGID